MSHAVAIVGGHGQVARHLHPLLVEAGRQPVALVRSEDQRADARATPAPRSGCSTSSSRRRGVRPAFEGCDAVVFAAGGGPDGNIERKRTVDLEGSLKSIEGARARRHPPVRPGLRDRRRRAAPRRHRDVWRAYVEAKRDADAALRASGLDWTIIRPGRLTDDPATGLVALGRGRR